MHGTEIHPVIKKITRFYYLVGFWHQGDIATKRELTVKLFYSLYLLAFVLSLAIGVTTQENRDESIYLAEVSVLNFVCLVKLCILIWEQKKIERLLHQVCVFTAQDDENFTIFNQTLSPYIKFANVLLSSTFICLICEVAIYPFIGSEKTIFLKIAFPLNWRNDEISFWMANFFFLTGGMVSVAGISLGVIVWYLLLVCSLRYKLLGSHMRKTDQRTTGQQIYFRDLVVSIKEHLNLQKYVECIGDFVTN